MQKLHNPASAISDERMKLANVIRNHSCHLSTLDEKYWTIIGSGSIGEKAEDLRKKAWALERAGFEFNPRVVLAMGFFDDFKKRSGLNEALQNNASSRKLTGLIEECEFNDSELRIFKGILNRFPGIPLAVRSSAHGDCRGTGIYESVFSNMDGKNDEVFLAQSIKEVLMSEFSESAISFRKDTGLANGMAVVIEPVVGQSFTSDDRAFDEICKVFGPAFGGIAYTSTSCGRGKITFASGLPTLAVRGIGIEVLDFGKRTISKMISDHWDDYEQINARGSFCENQMEPVKIDAGERINMRLGWINDFRTNETVELEKYNLTWLFYKLKKLEKLIGKPQYMEWAIIEDNGKPKVFALQIADVNIKSDFYDFSSPKHVALTSNFVVNSGVRICNEAVVITNPTDVAPLILYNMENKDYLLIYNGSLTSLTGFNILNYHHLSNSSAVAEIYTRPHAKHPIAHFEGMLQQSNKLFMVLQDIDWKKLGKPANTKYGGLMIYPIRTRVTVSEKQQKGIVEILE